MTIMKSLFDYLARRIGEIAAGFSGIETERKITVDARDTHRRHARHRFDPDSR